MAVWGAAGNDWGAGGTSTKFNINGDWNDVGAGSAAGQYDQVIADRFQDRDSGHMAKKCPKKLIVCFNCKARNDHSTSECKNPKEVDFSQVPDMSEEEAWALIKQDSDDMEVGDFKEHLKILSKANRLLTYREIEDELRKRKFNLYLIGLKKEVAAAYTNTNLQGETGKTFTLGVFTKPSCPRPVLVEAWPKNAGDNLKRLKDVGVPLESGKLICLRCGGEGHARHSCQAESKEPKKVICVGCGSEGHYLRDCSEPRPELKAPRACKLCGETDHLAAGCTSAERKPPIQCRTCFQEGHRAADCVNERVTKCMNCDAIGTHNTRSCPEPKDWSRVKCKHCGKMGHASTARCRPEDRETFAAAQAEKDGGVPGKTEDAGPGGASGWNAKADNKIIASGPASWETETVDDAVAVGGSW